MAELAALHDELRPLMFSVAYRMLGNVAEAEDVVQDAFLKMHRTGLAVDRVRSVDAFAVTVTTRLAIDALRSARVRRERYVGSWLPSPLIDTDETDPSLRVEADETVSSAFLAVLERLSPTERAVFLLREVFGYEYAEVGEVVGRTPEACRQLLSRARAALGSDRPRFEPSRERREALAAAFFRALEGGDLTALEELLAADVTFYGDGGGKAPAVRAPLRGRTQVARFLLGLVRQSERFAVTIEQVTVNGQPGARIVTADGALVGVLSVEIADGRVRSLQNQINPDKLRHLGRTADLTLLVGDRSPDEG
jgi:RNA polymerase sigma-70 factor (TIGR02957 family)